MQPPLRAPASIPAGVPVTVISWPTRSPRFTLALVRL